MYTISRSGKLNLLLILLATVFVWLFAWWFLADSLQFRYTDFRATWHPETWTSGQRTTAFFILVVLLGAPFVVWDVLTEWFARYTIDADGVQFSTLGFKQHYAWETMRELRTVRGSSESNPRIDVVINRITPISARRRFLHRRTIDRLPIYATVANRTALLATLTDHLANPQS